MRFEFVFSLLWTHFSNRLDLGTGPLATFSSISTLSSSNSAANKSVIIVGAGTGGLGALKAFTELPDETKQSLDFILFEEREDVGGVWLPDNHITYPPEIPETPLYPRLRANAPVPLMTFPKFPYPPNTPLCAHHSHVLAYHQRFASEFNLYPHIAFNHRVMEANWIGTPDKGQWNLTILNSAGVTETRMTDHLIDATGKQRIPNIPRWAGQDSWLKQVPGREIMHSMYYRHPERYTNRSVLVVGFGPSGSDISMQVSEVASKTYISTRRPPVRILPFLPFPENAEWKLEISHFTSHTVVFNDTTEIHVDAVILATGYQVRKPFLEAGNTMTVVDTQSHRSSELLLQTNRIYVHPLYRHVLSLSSSHPPTALSFVNLMGPLAAYGHLGYVLGVFIINLILNSTLVPTRQEMLARLEATEQNMREKGVDPYRAGNAELNGLAGASDYQDEFMDYLKEKGAVLSTPPKYLEPWRRNVDLYLHGCRGWKRIEQLGQEDEWLQGVKTEEQWFDLMVRVKDWQREWDSEHNITFIGAFDDELYSDEYHW